MAGLRPGHLDQIGTAVRVIWDCRTKSGNDGAERRRQ
jgi:hypothetical protein